MKNLKNMFAVAMLIGFTSCLSSCGMNKSIVLNHNANSTQVQLSGNNFKVVEKVSGSAEVSYILMIGGINKKQLFENAYSDMLDKAKLMNTSKALINIVTEEQFSGLLPFYYVRTITVSAHVIEFTK